MNIDVSQIQENILLAGRKIGQTVYEEILMNNLSQGETITFQNHERMVISNSFFFGLLSNVKDLYLGKSDMIRCINLLDLSNSNQKELLRGINRVYSH